MSEADGDFLSREIARRMDERLDVIRVAPRRILDLGCGTGSDLARLGERYPAAARLGIDCAAAALARTHAQPMPRHGGLRHLFAGKRGSGAPVRLAAAEAARLPLAAESVSLIWSNLMLPFVDEPLSVFQEAHRVLETNGLLIFSSLGPDSLRELGAPNPRFVDMHDLGDALLRAGFVDPVMDMEMLTLTYTAPETLFADLRATGLMGQDGDERGDTPPLSISIEIVQGHAWKAAPRKTKTDDRHVVRFHPP